MAAVLVGAAAYLNPEAFGIAVRITPIAAPSFVSILPVSRIEMGLGVAIGAITFSGSVIAFLKLNGNMSGKPILLPLRHVINLGTLTAILALIAYFTTDQDPWVFFTIAGLSFLIGFLLIIPIGGADMPVVISLYNALTGLAVAFEGFVMNNAAMIIAGTVVGSAGTLLTQLMAKAMNRSLANVLFSDFGSGGGAQATAVSGSMKPIEASDVGVMMAFASKVIVVPGYGMAVAQAQHKVWEMCQLLIDRGVTVKFAIHPVAGRMPGHMNVLLAEAGVPYDLIADMDDINPEFPNTDVSLVIGANDFVNPVSRSQDDNAAARAADTAAELGALSVRLHAALIKTGLRRR
jgi:NAD(P) transhydrogenase subunit beta